VSTKRALHIAHGAAAEYHKYAHANVSAASLLLNLNCHIDTPSSPTMGNAQSQNSSPHRIQKLPGKIAAKLPGVTPLGRAKDSGYRSGSASSSGTAVKGAQAKDATVVSTGSDKGSTSRPETAPAAAERHSDAPAPVTETVRRNHAIYGREH